MTEQTPNFSGDTAQYVVLALLNSGFINRDEPEAVASVVRDALGMQPGEHSHAWVMSCLTTLYEEAGRYLTYAAEYREAEDMLFQHPGERFKAALSDALDILRRRFGPGYPYEPAIVPELEGEPVPLDVFSAWIRVDMANGEVMFAQEKLRRAMEQAKGLTLMNPPAPDESPEYWQKVREIAARRNELVQAEKDSRPVFPFLASGEVDTEKVLALIETLPEEEQAAWRTDFWGMLQKAAREAVDTKTEYLSAGVLNNALQVLEDAGVINDTNRTDALRALRARVGEPEPERALLGAAWNNTPFTAEELKIAVAFLKAEFNLPHEYARFFARYNPGNVRMLEHGVVSKRTAEISEDRAKFLSETFGEFGGVTKAITTLCNSYGWTFTESRDYALNHPIEARDILRNLRDGTKHDVPRLNPETS